MSSYKDFIPNISLPGVGEIYLPGIGTNALSGLENREQISTKIHTGELTTLQLVKIIIKRLIYRQNPDINANPTISTVFGQPDFLPFPFLSLGIRRGAAVCRLIRKFYSNESAERFIDSIRQIECNTSKYFSVSELAEICAISIDRAIKLFGNRNNGTEVPLKTNYFTDEIKFIPFATGFLVGRNELLTNYHVFPEKYLIENEIFATEDPLSKNNLVFELDSVLVANEYFVQFGYEQDILGREIEPVEYAIEKLLYCAKDLDFALVKLQSEPLDKKYQSAGQAGDYFGWITMLAEEAVIAPPLPQVIQEETLGSLKAVDLPQEENSDLRKALGEALSELSEDFRKNLAELSISASADAYLKVLKDRATAGDPVNIIQHPKGRRKEVVLSNNRVKKLLKDFILYEADADYSSSGSPVLNQQWQLVGIHRGALLKQTATSSEKFEIEVEIGVRMSRIVEVLLDKIREDIKAEKVTDATQELWLFVRNFVQLKNTEDLPVLPELVFDKDNSKQSIQKSYNTQSF